MHAMESIEGDAYLPVRHSCPRLPAIRARSRCARNVLASPSSTPTQLERGAVGPRFGGAVAGCLAQPFEYISVVPSIAPSLQAGVRYATDGDKAGRVIHSEDADRRWRWQTAASVEHYALLARRVARGGAISVAQQLYPARVGLRANVDGRVRLDGESAGRVLGSCWVRVRG